MADNRIKQLFREEGQSAWQDDISRDMLNEGSIRTAIEETGIRGLTSNPTIFEKAIAAGSAYDEEIGGLLERDLDAHAIFETVAVRDIQGATDLFRTIYESSEGGDGFVSIEVSPLAARDPAVTTADARRLWSAVDRPNLMVKIPGTVEAVPIIQQMLTEGININITLLFSVAAYERVARAYISALAARQAAGQPIDRIASVASFFVSRVDTLVDKLLDEKIAATGDATQKGWLQSLKGKAAIANAKIAYQSFERLFSGAEWDSLAAAGADVQRPLWASTSVKNPAFPDTMYVDELIGPHTVNTMPRPTIAAFLDHGTVARTIDKDLSGAYKTMEDLAAAGIDIDAVTTQLEDEGIASFAKSYDSLLAGVAAKRSQLAGAPAD
ncbi:MAG TPA: transaldolase [Thermomicrobiales bacterium]|jgi:transaldolase|nr:transaldolase [Thermomicrobiales bacterium]